MFAADHPHDPALSIHNSVLEWPEVGLYCRGTAQLLEGRASVGIPEHFAHVASEDGLTVQLTPRSAASKGLAATDLTPTALEITELWGGTGTYDVDWTVQGIRAPVRCAARLQEEQRSAHSWSLTTRTAAPAAVYVVSGRVAMASAQISDPGGSDDH
jgi:hypothetical protein